MPHDAATRDKGGLALFIDIDALRRELVGSAQVPSSYLKALLLSLRAKFQGAFALISARPMTELDALLAGHMWTHFAAERACDRARAISALMEQAPFRGRTPLCIGDDATDEELFALFNSARGLSVRISASSASTGNSSVMPIIDAIRWLDDLPAVFGPSESCEGSGAHACCGPAEQISDCEWSVSGSSALHSHLGGQQLPH